MERVCVYCGKSFAADSNAQRFCSRYCVTRNYYKKHRKVEVRARGRFSGEFYENSPERILELKEKYKNGITSEIFSEFAAGQFFNMKAE